MSLLNKPGSVTASGIHHLSGIMFTHYLNRPTHQGFRRNWACSSLPWLIWSFSFWGLPLLTIADQKRELLPHVFTFSCKQVVIFCGTAVFVLQQILPVRKQNALCCPDFPPFYFKERWIINDLANVALFIVLNEKQFSLNLMRK